MGEHFYSSITIGGDIALEVADQLAKVIGEVVEPDFAAGWCAQTLLSSMGDDDTTVVFSIEEAAYDEFAATAVFCRRHGLPYDWFVDSGDHGNWHDTIEWWRPGMAEPKTAYPVDDDYSAPLSEIDKALEIMAAGDVDECRKRLQRLVSQRPPDMPPFKLALGKSLTN